ncbi:cytochrome c [bacterium]|nr:cytochrome c [bacterium]MBU1994299.1 cytochrome c [bacterium]
MKHLFFLLVPLFLLGETTFITPIEYASQLYKNPRGIGCQHCHGNKGEGKIIANYIDKKVEKSFGGPVINKLDFQKFYTALNVRKQGMPRYFLTDREIQALYLYLHPTEIKSNKKELSKQKQSVQNVK